MNIKKKIACFEVVLLLRCFFSLFRTINNDNVLIIAKIIIFSKPLAFISAYAYRGEEHGWELRGGIHRGSRGTD